jgi:hypothetical protein
MRTIGRLRDFVKGRAPTIAPTDVNAAVSEVLRLCEIVAHSRSIVINEALDPDLTCIWADRGALQQALCNCLFNALEAIDVQSGGCVLVSTRAVGDAIEIVVEDTGCGIAAERQDAIFEAEFTTKPEGNGLGLAIARHSIMQQGGTLSLLRSKVGEGSGFCLSLPLCPSPPENAQLKTLPSRGEKRAREREGRVLATLEKLDQCIARTEQRIVDQEMIIGCYRLLGRVPTESRRMLGHLNETLRIWHRQRELLRDMVQYLPPRHALIVAEGGTVF